MTNAEVALTPEAIRKARKARAREMPAGFGRMRAFPSQMRAQLVTKNNKNFYEVTGYATVFDRAYDMYDMFGPYQEIMSAQALDKSLANGPDVAFLLNHRGMTMARTSNATLELAKDALGLHIQAFLNAERQDVRDLASAINDGLIDEMSFAFMLTDGSWSDDYETFTITEADINRGDVSAVNYGANPYTSINARAAEWLELAEQMPPSVARAGFLRLGHREDLSDIGDWPIVDETGDDDEENPVEQKTGYAVELIEKRLKAQSR